jgi:hypothetical protein
MICYWRSNTCDCVPNMLYGVCDSSTDMYTLCSHLKIQIARVTWQNFRLFNRWRKVIVWEEFALQAASIADAWLIWQKQFITIMTF